MKKNFEGTPKKKKSKEKKKRKKKKMMQGHNIVANGWAEASYQPPSTPHAPPPTQPSISFEKIF